jgi:hypothetical protein
MDPDARRYNIDLSEPNSWTDASKTSDSVDTIAVRTIVAASLLSLNIPRFLESEVFRGHTMLRSCQGRHLPYVDVKPKQTTNAAADRGANKIALLKNLITSSVK